MSNEEAKDLLTHYICCCPYGTSPVDCDDDDECKFGMAIRTLCDNARPQGEWIPITMRPIEEEEKIDYHDATFMFDCPMPENGQNILVSTKYGVEYDTCYLDDGYYLDSDRAWEEVYAWQPLPKPYKGEEE